MDSEAMGLVERAEYVPASVGDIVDVAMPLKLVTTATVMGVLAGIIGVVGIVRPGTVAEMTMPTVAHSFWANIKAPSALVSERAGQAATVR